MEEEKFTLETSIEEGKAIRQGITQGGGRISVYHLADNLVYHTWKNKTIRLLSIEFKDDRCIDDFQRAIGEFEEARVPTQFDKIISILESCKSIPQIVPLLRGDKTSPTTINNYLTQTQQQSQEQQQSQKLVVEIFWESVKDEITGKQRKELEEILATEPDPEKQSQRSSRN